MSTSLSQYKTALTAAQTAYLTALNTLYGALIDLESLAATVEGIGGGAQSRFSQRSRDRYQDLVAVLEHPVAAPRATNFAGAIKASSGTLTSSPTLNVAAAPAWVVPGMVVTNLTAGNAVGTVSASTPQATTITLAANAANAVTTGDILAYSFGAGRIKEKIDAAVAAYMANWSGS